MLNRIMLCLAGICILVMALAPLAVAKPPPNATDLVLMAGHQPPGIIPDTAALTTDARASPVYTARSTGICATAIGATSITTVRPPAIAARSSPTYQVKG